MKIFHPVIFIIIMVFFAGTAHASIYSDFNYDSEPSIVEVQKVVLGYHNLEEKEVSQWKKRAKLSALLPRFQVSYDRRVKNDVDIDIGNNVYVGSSGVTVGPDEGTYSENSNSDQNVGVKAVWYLGELIFNPEQLDISRESRNLIRERQMLLAEVNKHYYERKRLRGIINGLESGKIPPAKKSTRDKDIFLASVKLEEETAALDALSGGWFSNAIGR